MINRYNITKEIKITKALSYLLSLPDDDAQLYSEKEALRKKSLQALDPAHCLMIIAKSPAAKLVLRRFINKNGDTPMSKIPDLTYDTPANQKGSKVSLLYLDEVIKFFKIASDEAVSIRSRENYPITFFTNDWEAIIAPRVDD